MSVLKRHFVWIILAIVLAAEGGVTFVLLGRKSEAKQKVEDLKRKKTRLAELEVWKREAPRLRKEFKRVRADLTTQRDNCALFFWRRDRALESLFDHADLAKFHFNPWAQRAAGFDRFRFTYQNTYNEEADKLVDAAGKLYIDRAGLGLASNTAFTQPHITVGDIYRAQKEFWLVKTIVDTALKAEISELDPIQISRKGKVVRRGRGMAATEGEDKKGKLRKFITVDVVVRCPYPRLAKFVHELHRSALPFQVQSLVEAKRGQSRKHLPTSARARRLSQPPMPGMGEGPGMTPEMAMEGMPPPVAEGGRRVPTEMYPPPGMEPLPPGMRQPAARPGMPATPGVPAESAAPLEELVDAQLVCEVADFTLGIARAKFTGPKVNKKDALKAWLNAQLSSRRGANMRPLWRPVLDALEAAQEVKEEGNSLEITFRPKEHFDQGEAPYDVSLELRDGSRVEIELRLITFEPAEGEQGVAKATPER